MMQDFCPVCRNVGVSSKIILVQINFEEAIWMCRSEKCHWPFGYLDFEILERHPNGWSISWNENLPNESAMYAPPLTPASESRGKECNLLTSIVPGLLNASVNVNGDLYSSSSHSSKEKSSSICCTSLEARNESPRQVTNYDSILLLDSPTNSSTESVSDSNSYAELSNAIQIEKSMLGNRRIPKKRLKQNKNDVNSEHVNITTVNVCGLPPVIISYPAPESTPTSMSKLQNVERCDSPLSSTDCSPEKLEKNSKVYQKGVRRAMKYQKFSFSKLREKLKEGRGNTKQTGVPSNVKQDFESQFKSVKLNVKIVSDTEQTEEKVSEVAGDTQMEMVPAGACSAETMYLIPGNISPGTYSLEELVPSYCLDNFLTDFVLTENQSLPQPVDDDWLSSLLY